MTEYLEVNKLLPKNQHGFRKSRSTMTAHANMNQDWVRNKMLRMVEGVSLKDHITSKLLLDKHKLPSVNQLNGEIKLLEAWKAIHVNNYPFKMEPNNTNQIQNDRVLRPTSIKLWKDSAKTKTGSNSFSIDTAKLWNSCPDVIKHAKSLGIAKSEIKKHCKTFEI